MTVLFAAVCLSIYKQWSITIYIYIYILCYFGIIYIIFQYLFIFLISFYFYIFGFHLNFNSSFSNFMCIWLVLFIFIFISVLILFLKPIKIVVLNTCFSLNIYILYYFSFISITKKRFLIVMCNYLTVIIVWLNNSATLIWCSICRIYYSRIIWIYQQQQQFMFT